MVLSEQASQLARRHSYGVRYPTDESLVAQIASGESAAFDMIFDRYYRPINNFIKRRIEKDWMVEDITQEVFMRVFKGARTFNGDKKFSSWVFKIASNEMKRHWKFQANRYTLSLNSPVDNDNSGGEHADIIEDQRAVPSTLTEQELLSRNLRAQIELLPEAQRTVVLLKTYQELTFAEISEICECPLSTVLSRMRYAVHKLRLSLGLQDGETAEQLRPTW